MYEQTTTQDTSIVCKYYYIGFWKFLIKCEKYHNNTAHKIKVCRKDDCTKIHTKTCTYFAVNNMCSYKDDFAFEQNTSTDNKNIDELEKEVAVLRAEIKYISKNNQDKELKQQNMETNGGVKKQKGILN